MKPILTSLIITKNTELSKQLVALSTPTADVTHEEVTELNLNSIPKKDLYFIDLESIPEAIDHINKIKQEYPLSETIVLTTFKDPNLCMESLEAGAYDYCLNPLIETELQNTIKHAIEKIGFKQLLPTIDWENDDIPLENKPKILIIEDEEDIRENMTIFLRKTYDIVCASTGKEAMDILQGDTEIQVILSDLGLPDIHGLKLIKQIKALDVEREIIIVSAFSDPGTLEEISASGAYNFLVKPFLKVDLKNTVKRAIEKTTLQMLL